MSDRTICPTCKATKWEHNEWQWMHCLMKWLIQSKPVGVQ